MIESASCKIFTIKKQFLTEKSLELNQKLAEIEGRLVEFVHVCNNTTSALSFGVLNTSNDDQDLLEGPLTTESGEGDPTPRPAYLQTEDSARSRTKSPTKLKLRDTMGTSFLCR